MNKKQRNIVFLTLVLALLLIFSVTMLSHQEDIKRYDEKDVLGGADAIAKSWRNDSYLVEIRVGGDISSEGNYYVNSVFYVYLNKNYTGELRQGLEVVYENGNYTKRYTQWPLSEDKPLGQWKIDCTDAYQIAINNDKIKAFMDRYPNAEIDGGLMLSNASGTPTWYIKMVDWGFLDDPHWAEIQIDATTGNVLYVNADLTGSSISAQDVCIGFSVVLIAIVAVMVFKKKRGKSRKENPDKEERGYEREERYER